MASLNSSLSHPSPSESLFLHSSILSREISKGSRLEQELEAGLRAVMCATAIGKELQEGIKNDSSEVFVKSDSSPVTIADLAIQALIVSILIRDIEKGREPLDASIIKNNSNNPSICPKTSVRVVAEEDIGGLKMDTLNVVVDKLNRLCPRNLIFGYNSNKNSNKNKSVSMNCDVSPNNMNDTTDKDIWTAEEVLMSFKCSSVQSLEELDELCTTRPCLSNQDNNHNNDSNRTNGGLPTPASSAIDYYWVLDPIDGTKGFVRGGQFAVGLGLIEAKTGVVQLGIIGCPVLPAECLVAAHFDASPSSSPPPPSAGCIFFATKGTRAKMISMDKVMSALPSNHDVINAIRTMMSPNEGNHSGLSRDVILSTVKEIGVSTAEDPSDIISLESYEKSHTDSSASQVIFKRLGVNLDARPVIRIDSMGKYGLIARGDGHIMTRFPKQEYKEKIWDICPGYIIVESAGGRVSHADGSSLNFYNSMTLDNTSGLVVTGNSPGFHQKVLDIVKETRDARNVLTHPA